MTHTDGHMHEEPRGDPPTSITAVRDLIVDRFTAAHGPRFSATRAALGLDEGHDAVRTSVQGMVRLAYTIAGGSFEAPTIEVTTKVVNLLSERSAVWGAPEDTVFEDHCDLLRFLGRLSLSGTDQG